MWPCSVGEGLEVERGACLSNLPPFLNTGYRDFLYRNGLGGGGGGVAPFKRKRITYVSMPIFHHSDSVKYRRKSQSLEVTEVRTTSSQT